MKGGKIMTVVAVVLVAMAVAAAGDTVQDDCAKEFPKVTTCLTFATGKADTPTKECCGSVSDLKQRKPVCLCYIIQQIHDGTNPQIKSMGIQEGRLLQLPSACKLTNASSAECPSNVQERIT
ncbi:OLC1v1028592C1 [Oldenlandia corymbosa var. corymbosa]|uniref:OLC1v1028592C1 n=1 Tax=Oldenlandia corymbosa var. corymbosa TaxID=529605 RepID=A0AAV1CEV4_OLDCO|nr:OLC1v1028592C1 [Oldenlandia corymbosa var. corymbosa]